MNKLGNQYWNLVALTGADEALAIGLVDRVCAPDDVHSEALTWAKALAKGPRIAMQAAKAAIEQLEQEQAALAEDRAAALGVDVPPTPAKLREIIADTNSSAAAKATGAVPSMSTGAQKWLCMPPGSFSWSTRKPRVLSW